MRGGRDAVVQRRRKLVTLWNKRLLTILAYNPFLTQNTRKSARFLSRKETKKYYRNFLTCLHEKEVDRHGSTSSSVPSRNSLYYKEFTFGIFLYIESAINNA